MHNYNEHPNGWQIMNYSELRTQEAEDEDSRRGLALTGNTPIGGVYAYGRLRTPEETCEGSIEMHFAKQGLDIRVEALDLENKTITISAPSENEYHIAQEYLAREGWTVSFDSNRIQNGVQMHLIKLGPDIRVEALNFENKIVTVSAVTHYEYRLAEDHLKKEGWEVRFDPKRLRKLSV